MGARSLFTEVTFDGFASRRFQEVKNSLESMTIEEINQKTDEDILEVIINRHGFAIPQIQDNLIHLGNVEPNHPGGTAYVFYVPFVGDKDLFNVQPRTNPPRIRCVINADELLFQYTIPHITKKGLNEEAYDEQQGKELTQRFHAELELVGKGLDALKNDFRDVYDGWMLTIKNMLGPRRDKFRRSQQVMKSTGYSLRRRDDAERFQFPAKPEPILTLPPQNTKVLEPKRNLQTDEYEQILETVTNMSLMMERSPSAFVRIGEEHLRDFFLVILNAMYQGNATGETFNSNGKTDILIREEGGNIFIAECKYWDGEATLTGAINQIVQYTTWRDTKTAVFMFNRNKNLSSVLKQIPEIVKKHPNYKGGGMPSSQKTRFQYIFSNRNDSEKEFILTILVFDVPTD